MKVYTRTGDKGTTSLATGERVSKTDARLEAYGTADELNSFVGLLLAGVETTPILSADSQQIASEMSGDSRQIASWLTWIQNRLFDLGAQLSCAPGEWIKAEDASTLEGWMDEMDAELEPMRAFLLPSGSNLVSLCHVCRTITRRLERRMLEIGGSNSLPDETLQRAITFVNRLSDFFFVLSRKVAKSEKIVEKTWQKR